MRYRYIVNCNSDVTKKGVWERSRRDRVAPRASNFPPLSHPAGLVLDKDDRANQSFLNRILVLQFGQHFEGDLRSDGSARQGLLLFMKSGNASGFRFACYARLVSKMLIMGWGANRAKKEL